MRVLILGAAGMIGHRVWLEARKEWGSNVFGVVRKSKEVYGRYEIFDKNIYDLQDVSNWASLEKILEEVRPDWIINAIGITIRKPEVTNLDAVLEINSFLPHRLVKWAQRNSAKVIHFSTDCVFNGNAGKYSESSNPTATDNYGKTKFLGEITDASGLTLRFSCIGRELESHTELLDWFLFQEAKTVKGFKNAIYSGVTTHVVASEVVKIIKYHPELNGIFQLSSTPISKYDLLCLIKDEFKLDVDIQQSVDYVSDKSLNSHKYSLATGFSAPSWTEMLKSLRSDNSVVYKEFKR